MASSASLIVSLLAIIAIVIGPALATDFIVGDDKGWALDVDYQAWAKSKTFYVGDRLIFRYQEGSHNVHIVNGQEFKQCEGSGTKVLESGNDTVVLAPGKSWYICGVDRHCKDRKMHMVIDVLAATSPPPAPANSVAVSANQFPFGWLIPAALSFILYGAY